MELVVHTQVGADTGRKLLLPEGLLVPVGERTHVLYLEIKRYLAAQRQGTHKSKERGDIRGSTRKIKKQKGTGTARAGSIKSPLFRGGGRVFGPRPRDYQLRLSKKARRLARRVALSEKVSQNALTLIEGVSFSEPKTKQYVAFLKGLQVQAGKSSLLVTAGDVATPIRLASRNLQKTTVLSANLLNAYAVLAHTHLIVEEKAVAVLEKLWT